MDNLGFGIVLSMQDAFSQGANRAISTMDRLAAKAFGLNQITEAVSSMTQALDGFTEPYIALDKSIKNIGSLGRENFQEFRGMVNDMMKELPDDAAKLADGIYDAIGSGIEGSNAELADYVKTTSKAAVAGLTDTSTATQGINAVMNAYKLNVKDATKISDTFFGGVNYGVMSFEELNKSLATVLPVAAASKVQFEELTGAMAAMTVQGVPANMAATQLRSAMAELIKPQKVLKGLYDKLGWSINDVKAEIAENGLIKTLEMLQRQATAAGMDMRQVFSSVEAGGAALLLTGENFEKSMGIFEDVRKSAAAGATAQAYAVQATSIENRLKVMRNRIQAYFNETFGEEGIIWLKAFNEMAPIVTALTPMFSAAAAGAAKLYRMLLPLPAAEAATGAGAAAASGGLGAMATAAWAAVAPLLPFIAIGAAVVALFYGMYKAMTSSNERWVKFGAIILALMGPVGWVFGAIVAVTRGIEDFKKVAAGGEIKGGILGFFQQLGGVITAVMEIWKSATDDTFALSEETGAALERMGILEFVVNLGTWIARIKSFISGVFEVLSSLWDKLGTAFDGIWDALGPLVDAFGSLWDAVMEVFGALGIFDGDLSKGMGTMEQWKEVGMVLMNSMLVPLKIAIDVIAAALRAIIGVITAVIKSFAWMITSIVGLFKGTTTFSDIGRDIVEGIWSGITGAWDWLVGLFKSLLGNLPFGDKIIEFFGGSGGDTKPTGGGEPGAGNPKRVGAAPGASRTSAVIGSTMADTKGVQASPSFINNNMVTERTSAINLNVHLDSEKIDKKIIDKQALDKARK